MANQIKFGIGFQVDKAGLNELQNALDSIAAEASIPSNKLNAGLQEAAKTAKIVEDALEKAFNVNLGTTNISKFNQELKNNNLTIQKVKTNLSQIGPAGANAFNLLGIQILKTNVQLKESNKLLDEMATSMANTVKWGITSSIFNNMASSIQKAYGYTKNLNSSLNDIRIVTDKSAESMEKFARQANDAAKGLGASTLDYIDASLIYYQQGLDDDEVAARAETTLKAANVTGQTGEEVSEQLTAVWNGYKVTAEEAELYVDKLAAVAASTASDLEELSTGMSKVASAANAMGVDIDQLNAQLATIVSVTRQAPESVGTALKTIYARMSDLKLGETDEDGLGLGDVSGAMEKMGISIMDETGNLRDMGVVIEEVAAKWDTWSEAQKTAMAQVMAGKRQYNNLVALFENWDMYTDSLETSANALGTLQKQQDIYMQSTEAKLQTLKTTMESVYSGLIDDNELNAGIDALTNLAQVADNFISSFGGGLKSIAGISAIIANIFNKQIANGINNVLLNHQKLVDNANLLQTKYELLVAAQKSMQGATDPQGMAIAANYDTQVKYAEQIKNLHLSMKTEEYERLTALQNQAGELEQQIVLEKEIANQAALKNGYTQEQIDNFYQQNISMEEIINNAEKELNFQQEKTQELEEQVNALKEIGNLAKQEQLTEAQIKDIMDIVVGIDEEILDNKEKNVKTVSDLRKLIDQINKSENNGLNANKKQTKEYQNQLKVLKQIEQAKNKTTGLSQQKNSIEQELNAAIEQQKQSADVLTQVTAVSSTLSSLAMTWMSVNGLMQSWSDDTASFGDKILQTVMTLGMAIPSVISSFVKIQEAMGATVSVTKALHTIQIAYNAQRAEGIGIIKALIGIHSKEQIQKNQEIVTQNINNRLLEKYAKLKGIEVSSISNSTRARILEIAQKKAETATTIAATNANKAFNASLLANPLTAIIAVLGIAIGALAAYTNAVKKAHEAEMQRAQSAVDEAKALRTEREELEKLQSTYNNLYANYITTGKATDELKQSILDLSEAYGIEIDTLDLLSERYDKINQKILEQSKLNAKADLDKAQEGLAGQEKLLLDKADYIGEGSSTVGFDFGFGTSDETEVWSYLGDKMPELAQEHGYNANKSRAGLEFIASGIDSAEEFIAFYNDLQNVYNEMSTELDENVLNASEAFHSIQTFLTDNKTLIEDYQQLITDIETYGIQYAAAVAALNNKNISLEQITDTKSYTDYRNNFKTQLQETLQEEDITVTEERLEELVDNYLSQFEFLSKYMQDFDIREEFKEKVLGTSEDIEAFLNEVEAEGNLELLATLGIDENASLEAIKEGYEYVKAKSENDFNQEGIQATTSALNSLNENKDLSGLTEEETTNFNTFLESSDGIYDNAIPAAEEWAEISKQGLVDQIAYLTQLQELHNYTGEQRIENAKQELEAEKEYQEQLLKDLQQREDSYDTDSLRFKNSEEMQEDYRELQEEIVNTKNRIDELNETLEDSDHWRLELETDTLDYFTTQVDNIISQADALKSAAELIGEGFLVAAEDAEELAKVYPELMQEAEVLADGSIQLSQQIVQAIMDGNNAAITSNSKVTEKQLEDKIALVDAEIAFQETKLQILQNLLNGEISKSQAAEQLAKNENQYKENLVNAFGLTDSEATNQEIQRHTKSTDINLDNLDLIDERIAEISEHYSKMLSGEKVTATGGKNAIGGSAGSYTNINNVSKVNPELSQSEIEKIQQEIDSTKSNLESLYGSRGTYTALLSKIRAGSSEASEAMEGASSGKGGKQDDKDGSGGSKEERNAEYKNADEEIDRYWELNKAIEQVTEALSDLDKKQEKLYGRELINSLKQENELLAQQAQAYENLAAEQQKEAAELRGTLSAYGVVFDAQGGVTNYLAASQAALEQYNAAVAAYNAFLIDEATFQAAERAYENFKAQLDRYETLYYDEMVDTQNQLDDIRTKTLENNLKAWETELQIRLDLHEAERDWNDFLNEINEDFKSVFKDLGKDLNTMLENATEYADLNGNMIVEEGQNSIPFAGTLGVDIAAMQDVMGEIDKLKNGGTSDMFSSMSEAQEKLKELINQTMEDTKALQDLYQEAWETYMEGIDQSAEKFEDLMDKFSLIDDELAYQGELIELLYGEEAYGLMNKLYDAQAKNGLEQIKSLQQQKDMWYNLWQTAEEGSEEQKKYYELWTQAQGDLNNKVTEYIKLLKDDYANTIDGILKDLETKLSGGSSFDDIADEWDNITDRADNYLDNVEKMYEIQSLANKINSDIDDGSISLKNQQKLQEFRDKEIAALREKEKLTQYDLDAADARYEIMLKEIALEDAQNAKNSMKLTRGTDGNWSYQYVADEEQSANAQQELLDAYNNYYQLADEAYAKNLQRMQELQQAYVESIREIMADETLSAAEKEAKIAEIRQRFEEDYSLLVKDNTKIRDDLAIASSGLLLELFNTDKENYKQMTDDQKALVDGLISNNITDFLELENAVTTNFDGIGDKANTVMAETSEAWDSGAQGMIQNTENIQEAINNAYDAIIEANDEYQKAVNEAAAAVDEDWSENGIAGSIGKAEEATESLNEATEDLVEETKSNLDDYKAAVEAIEEIWYAVKGAILEALEAAREYANLEPPEAPTYTPPTVPTTPGGGNGTYGGGSGSKGGGNGNNPSGPAKKVARFLSGGYGDGVYTFSLYGVRYYTGGDYGYLSSSAKAALKGAGYTHYSRDDKYETALKTGGYTGSWTDGNPEVDNGKLAWLHQKELVLNAKDTENILDAVQTVRNLSNLSSSIEDMIMRNLSSMIIKMANIGTNVNYSTENSEQSNNNTFNITAEFPNANDVTSIREAILSLPNIASQYIHENRK